MSVREKLKSFKFKTKSTNPTDYIGRTVIIDGKPVMIETIVGNKEKPTFFDINGGLSIGVLRFFCQMNGDRSISEEQFKKHEEMECWVEEKKTKNIAVQDKH